MFRDVSGLVGRAYGSRLSGKMGEFSQIDLATEMERRIMARTRLHRFIEQLSPETVPAKHHNLLLAKLIEIERGLAVNGPAVGLAVTLDGADLAYRYRRRKLLPMRANLKFS